jgi:hypothetical protein
MSMKKTLRILWWSLIAAVLAAVAFAVLALVSPTAAEAAEEYALMVFILFQIGFIGWGLLRDQIR